MLQNAKRWVTLRGSMAVHRSYTVLQTIIYVHLVVFTVTRGSIYIRKDSVG